jgi:hypothetical protein
VADLQALVDAGLIEQQASAAVTRIAARARS